MVFCTLVLPTSYTLITYGMILFLWKGSFRVCRLQYLYDSNMEGYIPNTFTSTKTNKPYFISTCPYVIATETFPSKITITIKFKILILLRFILELCKIYYDMKAFVNKVQQSFWIFHLVLFLVFYKKMWTNFAPSSIPTQVTSDKLLLPYLFFKLNSLLKPLLVILILSIWDLFLYHLHFTSTYLCLLK